MSQKTLPFSAQQLNDIVADYPTPFHIYDEKAIRKNAQEFYKAFEWVPGGFKNFYAVKALPNPYILKILQEEGMGADCSSYPEILLSEKSGITGEDIIFTSNDTPVYEYVEAKKSGAIINLDDITHIDFLEKECGGLPELVCFRYNPGSLKEGNDIIGKPEDAKYGFTGDQIVEGFKILKEKGVKRFGLHTMVASNEINPDYFAETAGILFDMVVRVHKEVGIEFEFANLGGGIGVAYKPEDVQPSLQEISDKIKTFYDEKIVANGINPFKIVMECGRMVTGPYGYLVSECLHIKKTYKTYAGLDSCMTNLMRPALYDSYHHVTVAGKENDEATVTYDVTGSLCENNDKFAIDRMLPEIESGDLVVIHDTGAHGHSMGFNYNAKLRSAELLLQENGSVKLIRRAETIEDHFATLDFSGV
ncbi:MAG: diaminopimelate decarboxylase [Fibrobacterales bacterium]